MSDHAQEFVNARPRQRPWHRALRELRQQLARLAMMLTRRNLGVDEEVGVDRLQCLSSVHQVKQLIAVQQVNAWLFFGLPAVKSEAESLARTFVERLA